MRGRSVSWGRELLEVEVEVVESNSAEKGSLLGREPGSMPPVPEAADHLLLHCRCRLADCCSIWILEENLKVKLPSLTCLAFYLVQLSLLLPTFLIATFCFYH